MTKSVEELSSIGTSFSGSLVCVSAIVTFGWDCVQVRTLSVGDETVTAMLGVGSHWNAWCRHHFGGLLSSQLIAFLQ